MEDKKVSIIVPVYNVEKYLEVCVESLRAQTYRNLEILLVDDGAKDASPELCDALAKKDSRIRVIHKPNGGAASARNAGIDAATGALVCFVDSDDVTEPDYVKKLVQAMADTDADAAVCGFRFWTRRGMECCTGQSEPGIYSCEDYMLRFLEDWSCSLLWNKIFLRSAVGSIRMEVGHRVDDEYFTYQVCMNCRRIAVIDSCLYRYRLRASSAMQDMASVQEKIMLDRIGYNLMRYGHIVEKMPQLEEAYFIHTLDTLCRYWYHSKDMPEAQRQVRSWFAAYTGRLLKLSIPLRRKLAYLRQMYLKKPAVIAEPNPIQMDESDYFA